MVIRIAAASLLALIASGCPAPFPAYEPPTIPDMACADCETGPPPLPPPDALLFADDMAADSAITDAQTFDSSPAPDSGVLDAEPDLAIPDAERLDAAPPPELCDGLDDDGDGAIDEGPVCGPYVAEHCVLGLGWMADDYFPAMRTESFLRCRNAVDLSEGDAFRCVHTAGDGRFRTVQPPRAHRGGDVLGLRFSCADAENDDLQNWIEARCVAYIGHGPSPIADRLDGFGSCPGASGIDGGRWCVTTAGDADFNAAGAPLLAAEDTLAIGFVCDDPEQPARAAGVTASVSVWLGWSNACPADRSDVWGRCPPDERDDLGGTRCIGTAGDGLARTLPISVPLGPTGCIGIALRAYDPAGGP